MKKTFLLSTAALLVFAAPLFAKDMKATAATEHFVKNAVIGGKFEIESSEIALDMSDNAEIKAFAKQMIADHKKADMKLKETVQSGKLDTSLTDQPLDAKHQAVIDALKAEDKTAFDAAYVKAQKDAHKETIDLFEGYAEKGDNAPLKSFAKETLPTLEMHEKHVNALKAS